MNRVVVIGKAGLELRLAVPRLPPPGDADRRRGGTGGENGAVSTSACSLALTFAHAETNSGDVPARMA